VAAGIASSRVRGPRGLSDLCPSGRHRDACTRRRGFEEGVPRAAARTAIDLGSRNRQGRGKGDTANLQTGANLGLQSGARAMSRWSPPHRAMARKDPFFRRPSLAVVTQCRTESMLRSMD
jgi:hypothetical protein